MMLDLEPAKRPQLADVMVHPWLAPHLYRLPATLGSLPCTSKAARPLSSVRFNQFDVDSQIPYVQLNFSRKVFLAAGL